MKLHAEEIVFLHGGGEGLAVVCLGDGAGAYRHRIAVYEIEVGAVIDAAEQMVPACADTWFQPMCGSGRPKSVICFTGVSMRPSVVTPPFSSLLAASSCMPRQMPSTGCVQA